MDAAGGQRAGRGGRATQAHGQRRRRTRARSCAPMSAEALAKDGAVVANEGDEPVDAVVYRDRRGADAGAGRSPRASPLSAATTRSTARRWTSRAPPAATPAEAERPSDRRGQVELRRDRRAHPARRPPAGRLRDREPAPGRLRRRQDARLAQDLGEAGAHRVPRRPLRRRVRLLRIAATGVAAGATPTATRSIARRSSATVAYLVRAVTPG